MLKDVFVYVQRYFTTNKLLGEFFVQVEKNTRKNTVDFYFRNVINYVLISCYRRGLSLLLWSL